MNACILTHRAGRVDSAVESGSALRPAGGGDGEARRNNHRAQHKGIGHFVVRNGELDADREQD